MKKETLGVLAIRALALVVACSFLGCAEGGQDASQTMAGKRQETAKISTYEAQLEALHAVDEALILYRETRFLVPPGLNALTAIAVDAADRIYAGGGRKLVVLTSQGDEVRRIDLDGDVSCLAVDADNRIYVGLGAAVQVYDADGERSGAFSGLGTNAIITALVATEEDIFVADAQSRAVLRFDPAGTLKQTIDGKLGLPDDLGFVIPSPFFDLALGQGGTLWIVNPGLHRLEEYNFRGERIGFWQQNPGMGVESFCGCCNPAHVAQLRNGTIVTSEKGLQRVKVYTRRGQFIGVVAAPKQFGNQDSGLDLAVDSNDRILVADPANVQIRIFELK